jgi:hypothetical protein
MAVPIKQAFTIGNDAYSGPNRLESCVSDATDVSICLRSIGFQVHAEKNLDYYQMQIITQRFIRSIQPGAIVLFYFSGHGVQSDGYNFLIPTNDEGISADTIKETALSAERLIYDMHLRSPRVVIVILDSCRTYWGPGSLLPALRSDGVPTRMRSGLVPMQAPPATIVAYACAAEAVSSPQSRNGRNSMYTYHLLRYITTPNVDVDYMLRNVALDVQRDSNNTQIPYRYSSCNEYICLAASPGINIPAWPGVMQSPAVFCKLLSKTIDMFIVEIHLAPLKNLFPQMYSNRHFQPTIDRYQNRWNYQFHKPRHHHSFYMYTPSKLIRHSTELGYPFIKPFYYRRW